MKAPESVTDDEVANLQVEVEGALDILAPTLSDVDMVETVWWRTKAGFQPVLWPLVVHRHGLDCNRA